MNGPKRFGLSQDCFTSGVWLVEPKPNAKPIKAAIGSSPAFSPDGRLVVTTIEALARGMGVSNLWLTDLASKKRRIYLQNAADAVWSPDGKVLALVFKKEDSEQTQIRVFPSGKLMWSDEFYGNPCDIQFSPTGRYLTVHHHLSRPLTGHSVFDLRTKKEITVQNPSRYAPPVITDWTKDGQSILCSWRIQDGDNDGSWIREDIGLTSLVNGKFRNLGRGSDAKFVSDGKQIVYLDSRSNLMVKSTTRKAKATRLARSVGSFAVSR
jgi:Tol biopolymer transport system component